MNPQTRSKLEFDSPEQELYLNLWRTYDCLKAIEDRVLVDYGLSAQQYNLLRILEYVAPAVVPTLKLGQALISRAPDVTRILDRLERRDLVARERSSENRRIVNVRLTDDGFELLTRMREKIAEMNSQQLGHLTVSEQRQLLSLLKRARQPHDNGSSGRLNDLSDSAIDSGVRQTAVGYFGRMSEN